MWRQFFKEEMKITIVVNGYIWILNAHSGAYECLSSNVIRLVSESSQNSHVTVDLLQLTFK